MSILILHYYYEVTNANDNNLKFIYFTFVLIVEVISQDLKKYGVILLLPAIPLCIHKYATKNSKYRVDKKILIKLLQHKQNIFIMATPQKKLIILILTFRL